MTDLIPVAPEPVDAPILMGTTVILDSEAKFLDRDLLAGGAPWRLLHLPGGSRSVAERWIGGGVVGAGEERFARTLVQQGLLHPLYHGDVNIDDIDVIIPVRDDVASLRSLLAQLVGFHVTVIDDGSTHLGLVSECAGQFGVKLIRLEDNKGPAGARNAGFLATSTRRTSWGAWARNLLIRCWAPLRHGCAAVPGPPCATISNADSAHSIWVQEAAW